MGFIMGYNRESRNVADELGGLSRNPDPDEAGNNDQYDAFRHAYTSAFLTKKFGSRLTKWLGDGNEGPYDPDGKHCQDPPDSRCGLTTGSIAPSN